ncbi:hypothetical protein C8R46DRAFT_1068319, partial [Mycena filopes]
SPRASLKEPAVATSPAPFLVTIAFKLSVAVCGLALGLAMYLAGPPTTYAVCSRNGKIYTVDPKNSQVDCIVVNHSIIVATGTLADTKVFTKLPIRYVPENAIVVPGLSDSHGHVLEYGATRQLLLEGTTSIAGT